MKTTSDIVFTGTASWERWDKYSTSVICKNRFISALRVLFSGKIKLEWYIKASQKDKKLKLTGERKV